MRTAIRRAAAALAVSGLAALSITAAGTAAGASTAGTRDGRHCIQVRETGTAVTVSQPVTRSGLNCFIVSTTNPAQPGGGGGGDVSLFRPAHGVSLARLLRDAKDEFSQTPATAAKGTRELNRDGLFYGLALVLPGHPETVTENLRPGTYWLGDIGNTIGAGKPVQLTRLTVLPSGRAGFLRADTLVQATSADRFIAPRFWPHEGSYLFANVADTIHFMEIAPVKNGTTDRQIQKFFDSHSQSPPPFLRNGPFGGNDVVSPGHLIKVSYDLPRGTYVLLCFVADDMTGMPHAFMGMHLVIHLV
jgi:hypothetical protein